MGPAFYIVAGFLVAAAWLLRTRWNQRVDPDPRPGIQIAAFDAFKDMALVGLLFGAIGPLVGYAALFTTLMFQGMHASDLLNWKGHLIFLFFAYVLGAIPAVATGAFAGAVRPWLAGWRGVLAIGVIGFLMTWLMFAGYGLGSVKRIDQLWQPLLDTAGSAALLGLPAGLICGALYLRRRRGE